MVLQRALAARGCLGRTAQSVGQLDQCLVSVTGVLIESDHPCHGHASVRQTVLVINLATLEPASNSEDPPRDENRLIHAAWLLRDDQTCEISSRFCHARQLAVIDCRATEGIRMLARCVASSISSAPRASLLVPDTSASTLVRSGCSLRPGDLAGTAVCCRCFQIVRIWTELALVKD